MKQTTKFADEKKITKLKEGDKYLSYHILKAILQETDVPKKVVEEKNSELFYETLSGKGKIIFSNAMKYYGPVKNGLLETEEDKERDKEKEKDKDKDKERKKETCIIVFSDGTKYEGEIHSNKISGEGKYYFPSGAKYSGHLLNGLRDGFGKYFSPEGITYEGEWKGGLKEGKGIMKCVNMTYEGEWKKGNIDGEGKIRWENGNLYEGEFKVNHINGYGYMIWHDLLEKYIGKWKDDKQNGNGIHIWYESPGELKEMRNRYIGEWKNGQRDGYGIFFYSNGGRYEGEWKNNLKTGFGIMIYEDGKKYIGRFEEDRQIDKNNELSEEKLEQLFEEYLSKKSTDKGTKKSSFKKQYTQNISYKIGQNKNFLKKTTLLNINSVQNAQEVKEIKENENTAEENKQKADISMIKSINTFRINANKKLYKFIPIFDLTDLEYNYPDIINDEEEIIKVLLRNLTGINKLYNYLNKISKIEVINEETGNKSLIIRDDIVKKVETTKKKDFSRISNRSSNMKLSVKKSVKSKGGTLLQINTNLTPKIEEQIRSDDIYFCIQSKDFWQCARENGLFNNEISISEFNRIFNQGKNNDFETFQLPNDLTESRDIYNYIDNIINQSKENFKYKYQAYINYYYKDKTIPESIQIDNNTNNNKKRIINSIHDNKRIILPRFFYECLIRLAFLSYNKSNNIEERNMKLSKKLEQILEIIIPPKMKKKLGISVRTNISKLEQSFNNSANIIEGNRARIAELKTIEEFMSLFHKDLKYIFNKLYIISHTCISFYNNRDKTINHLFLYKKVVCTSIFLRKIIPNILSYIEIASYFYKAKLNFMETLIKMKKDEYFDTINDLLLQEISEYEFNEIIYLICKKYLSDNNKKLTFNEIAYFFKKIKEDVDGLKISKNLKSKYFYPVLPSHEMKKKLILEEKIRIEEERRKKLERERFLKERENFGKEDVNAFIENYEEEEDNSDESEDLF